MEQASAVLHRHEHHAGGGTKEIIRVTIILSVLTLIELALGVSMINMVDGLLKHFIKGVIVILMLAKAFYIIGYFMHLKHEFRTLIMTLAVPAMSFIWFILAFIWDGHSYNELRNAFNPYYKERSTEKVAPKPEEKKPEQTKPQMP
ncbi:MAG: cytochrome C oxidase subunit IV family protein [Chitinophagaceae bacterium]